MMSNNIITHTYENNLRIRSLLANVGPGGPPCDKCSGGGGGADPVVKYIAITFSVVTFIFCLCLNNGITPCEVTTAVYSKIYYYFCRAEAVDVARERVHCSDTEDDVL